MREDRLDQAIEAMKNEAVDPERAEAAGARVLEALTGAAPTLCGQFRRDFGDWARGVLPESRRMLLEDHLGRCPACREHLAGMEGRQRSHAMPPGRRSPWPRRAGWAAAAAAALGAFYLARGPIGAVLAPGAQAATVETLQGRLLRVPGGDLSRGDRIVPGNPVRTAPGAQARIRLADGSLVDVNQNTEFSLDRAAAGPSIRLRRGDIVVRAARQRGKELRVETRDAMVSVHGTVFGVSSGIGGTLVSVLEGSVSVAHSGSSVRLGPGEQASTNPQLSVPVEQAVSWSPDAQAYADILASLVQVERRMAELPRPELPRQSRLLGLMPAGTAVYGAVANPADTLDQAVALMEEQAAENPYFGQWWQAEPGQNLRLLLDRVRVAAPYLGDEIVFALTLGAPGGREIPVLLAEVAPGGRPRLEEALAAAGGGAEAPVCYLDDRLLLVTAGIPDLEPLTRSLGQGAASPFAREIASRYREGLSWLLAIDAGSLPAPAAGSPGLLSAMPRHLFFDGSNPAGAAETRMTVDFGGPRSGLASLLADAGAGGAAEYVSADALAAGYIATMEPRQLFEELLARLALLDPSVLEPLEAATADPGLEFAVVLAHAVGTESAFSIEGLSTRGPAWMMAVLAHDPDALDDAVARLVEECNARLAASGRPERAAYARETVDGRTWSSIRPPGKAFAVTWTFDHGYLVAASDRATAQRAIATRDGGSPLLWSAPFREQLPASSGLHPSAFLWINTRGMLGDLAGLLGNPAYRNLLSGRDPILVVFDAGPDRIRAISRTGPSGVLVDLMLLKGLTGQR